MSTPQSETDLALYVARRAHISMHLIGGLRTALEDLDRPDMVQVLALIERQAFEAHAACLDALHAYRQAKGLRVLSCMQELSNMGGPRAEPIVSLLAKDISSGAHRAYRL